MCSCSRRTLLGAVAGLAVGLLGHRQAFAALHERQRAFVDTAFAMKAEAERAGDQSYGAVVVRGGDIVGWGPSRVVVKKDWTAHAEREAIRDAQARLRTVDLSGCVIYSTSRPCSNCERAAAEAKIERMFFGADAIDAGRPKPL
jgi:tRNA(Arg) A34 adenosine deaminase TadA